MNNVKVLVVDDTMLTRVIISAKLSKLGFEVIEASSGEEAVKKVKSINPEIVIMDILMGRMDGNAATRIITNEPNAKVIVCSALLNKRTVIDAVMAGAVDYIAKHIDTLRLEKGNEIHMI